MSTATWDNLSTQSPKDWPVTGLVILLHVVVVLGIAQLYRPGEPVKTDQTIAVQLIQLPQPKPVVPKAVPPPPKPEPRPPEPQKKRIIAQTRPDPEPAPMVVPAQPPPRAPARPAPVPVVIPPDIKAAYRSNPAPVYPMRSRRLGEEGRVLLRAHITAAGRVDEIAVKNSSGHGRLDQSALDAVRAWKFQPARLGDQAISAWVLIPIHFNLS